MLNIAIVDDEKEVASKLKSFVDRFFGEEKTGSSSGYEVKIYSDGVDFLSSDYGSFDIVFMDICMPLKNGLDVSKIFRERNDSACLIFVTNLADMAIRGYEVNAFDFVVKPIDYNDFRYRMAKALKRVGTRSDYIVISDKSSSARIDVQSILYVEMLKHRVIYHLIDRDLERWGTMRETEKNLCPYGFSRCNSGYLVNLRHVDNVRGNTVYIGKLELTVSRSRKAAFMADMLAFLGGGVH